MGAPDGANPDNQTDNTLDIVKSDEKIPDGKPYNLTLRMLALCEKTDQKLVCRRIGEEWLNRPDVMKLAPSRFERSKKTSDIKVVYTNVPDTDPINVALKNKHQWKAELQLESFERFFGKLLCFPTPFQNLV